MIKTQIYANVGVYMSIIHKSYDSLKTVFENSVGSDHGRVKTI